MTLSKRPKVEDPKFVVAIDFGTTFSKAAYAVEPDRKPGSLDLEKEVYLITDWPSQEAGGGAKCFKTKTCVWYMPGPEPLTFELKAWGWEAYVQYREHVQELAKKSSGVPAVTGYEDPGTPGQPDGDLKRSSCRQQELLSRKHGYLIDSFKLLLFDDRLDELPKGLSVQRIIAEFLTGMSIYVLQELQQKHGRDVSKRDIKWCITVPALWDECHRQQMEDCAEMAGLVLGPMCDDVSGSAHDLITVVEPEAASIYCHNTLQSLGKGNTFVVVDLGGGTTDLVTHKRIGSTTRSNVRVKEVTRSVGGLFGGVHVDERFLEHMRKVIKAPHSDFECFGQFERLYPAHVLNMMIDWGRIKTSYEGENECGKIYDLNLPRPLAKLWKRHQRKTFEAVAALRGQAESDVRAYLKTKNFHQIELKGSQVKEMFDDDMEPILSLIEKKIVASARVDYVLIVGGFSESPYVRKRIVERFADTYNIVFPRNPDTAVVRGAVALGVRGELESFVKSRIARKTYGFDTTVRFNEKIHPLEYLVHQKDQKQKLCDNVFYALIRKGEEVPFDSMMEYYTTPLYRKGFRDDNNIVISLFSTSARNPQFVVEKGVTKEATCVIPVPRKGTTGKTPRLRIAVHFGGTRIRLAVWGTNFSGERIMMPPVRLKCLAHRDYQEQLELETGVRRKKSRSSI